MAMMDTEAAGLRTQVLSSNVTFRTELVGRLDMVGLKILALECGGSLETIGGTTKVSVAMNLIKFMSNRGEYATLVDNAMVQFQAKPFPGNVPATRFANLAMVHLSKPDIANLCLLLDKTIDEFGGDTLQEQAVEVWLYTERVGMQPACIDSLTLLRGNVDWKHVIEGKHVRLS